MQFLFICTLAFALVRLNKNMLWLAVPVAVGYCLSPFLTSGIFTAISPQKVALIVSLPFLVKHLLQSGKFKTVTGARHTIWYLSFLAFLELLQLIIHPNGNLDLIKIYSCLITFLFSYSIFYQCQSTELIKYFSIPVSIVLTLCIPLILSSYFFQIDTIGYQTGDKIGNSLRLGAESAYNVNVWASSVALVQITLNYCFLKAGKINSWFNLSLIVISNVGLSLLILFSLSRGASILMFWGLIAFLPVRRRYQVLTLFVSLIFLEFIPYNLNKPSLVFDRLSLLGTEADISFLGRLNAYRLTWEAASDQPFLGVGPSFPDQFDWATENTFLFLTMRYGILGLGGFIIFMFTTFFAGKKSVENSLLLGAPLLYCFLDDTAFISTFWFFLGFALAQRDKPKHHYV